jgi:ferredoxin
MIHTKTVPHRFEKITKSGIIAWEEGCLKCAVCVKKKCVYGVYDNRHLDTRQMVDSIDNQCMNCLRCVQNCPKELIHKSFNPEYKSLGNGYWTPDIIARLWYQAETGKIPVSGAGYPGPYSGPGFDSMWTDMSEIVRPTRDGIHGREYISTAMDMGRSPKNLLFNESGDMDAGIPCLIDIPLPLIMRVPPFGSLSEATHKGWAMAAERLGIFLAIPYEKITDELKKYSCNLIPIITPDSKPERPLKEIRLVETAWSEACEEDLRKVRDLYPQALNIVRLPLGEGVEKRILPLVDEGISIFYLEGTSDGRTMDNSRLYIKDAIRSVHLALVEEGIRDEITLLAGGGIAMAEHVAKSIICGVDALFVDIPFLIALECRMCLRCEQGLPCPVEIESADPAWVGLRAINLLGAWHNQILEVMGAMGIRDVRRLRGEAGRAMFFEELDKSIFGSLGIPEEGSELE